MQQGSGRRLHKLFSLSARKIYWLTIVSVSLLLFPVEIFLETRIGRTKEIIVSFYLFAITCFVGGALSVFFTNSHVKSRKVLAFMERGSMTGYDTGLLHVLFWGILLIWSDISTHMGNVSGMLVSLIIFIPFMIGCLLLVIIACIGGLLAGFIKGCIVRFTTAKQPY
ncbi:hypothetical protein [Dictyobacter alpinus]|uniref:hypothetical protein n=1 Tax=Dictyobacter alpinus TaxID=2014873 RepID=UPI000F81CF5C|nr:hypothetical protein [Dictyobacter alpinus]